MGRQGQGNEDEESNYNQLIHLRAKDHPELLTWSKKKKDKYTCHDSQNEIIKLMSHNILREVGDNIKKAKWFSIIRDIANKEQLTICLRWVDDDLEPHENFIGFYEIPNINADTIFSAIQDCLIRMDLSLQNCRGQCYDGAGSMMGIRNGLATKIQKKVTADT